MKLQFKIIQYILYCIVLIVLFSGISSAYPEDLTISNITPEKQKFIYKIGVDKIKFPFESETQIIKIGVLDSGVELEHSFLKKYLVKGINILNYDISPEDDYGHGTSSSGVIAEIINKVEYNFKDLDIKIMPIKVLNKTGKGSAEDLIKGLQYAIDNNCKIVLLSLGLHYDSIKLKYMIELAEKHNVIVVSATGNDGKEVQYPAAYPTVLGVGGVDENNNIVQSSSYGSGIDIVAPWRVYTTILGGGFDYKQGTSMSAPQVAAVAALILKQNPKLKPYQIRNLILQKTKKLSNAIWNERTGYGLLEASKAFIEPYIEDMYEPNNNKIDAKPLPFNKMTIAQLNNNDLSDWYYLNSKFKGHLNLVFSNKENIKVTLLSEKNNIITKNIFVTPSIDFNLAEGANYLHIEFLGSPSKKELNYQFTPYFNIYKDEYESNETLNHSFKIDSLNFSLDGTLDSKNDKDWYKLKVDQKTIIRLNVTSIVNSTYTDLVIAYSSKNKKN